MAGGNTESRRINVFVNNKMIGVTPAEMRKEYRLLNNELAHLQKGSEAYNNKVKELGIVSKNLQQHREKITGINRAWQQTKTIIAGVAGGQIVTSALNKLIAFFPDMVRRNAELSDSFADVMKTTGMTEAQVHGLTKELKKINTRTAKKELLELAYLAGKLGNQSKEDVLGFVRAADKINVALGKDLGKDAVLTIGKLVNVFGLKEKFGLEESMLKVASTMNELGMASEASEGFMAEFMKRLGGVAPLVKLTAPEVLALGATLDSLGQTSEVSSTALSKMFMKMAKDAEAFAKFAGVSGPEFRKMMEEDFMGAFLQVLEGARKSSNGINELASTLGDLGLDGGRIIGVFGTLANNTATLRQQMNLANKSFDEGTSVLTEFNIKNENLAANLEKIGKRLAQFYANSAISTFFNGLAARLADTTSHADKLGKSFYELKKAQESSAEQLIPLTIRYDELSRKTTLNRDEQGELKKIIEQISTLMPTAATGWDEYGKAIGISTDKVREHIELERQMILVKNKEAIRAREDEMAKVEEEIEVITRSLNLRDKEGNVIKHVTEMRKGAGGEMVAQTRTVRMTNEEIKTQTSRLIELQSEMRGYKGLLAELRGMQMGNEVNLPSLNPNAYRKPENPEGNDYTEELSDKEKKKIEKLGDEALKAYEKLLEDVKKKSDEIFYASLPETDQVMIKMSAHYDALREQARAALEKNATDPAINGTQRKEREQAILDSILLINQTHDAEMDAHYEKVRVARAAKRQELQDEIWLMSQTEQEQELITLMQAFDAKVAMLEEYGIETQTLTEQTEKAIEAIRAKWRQKDLDEQKKLNEKKAQLHDQYLNDAIMVYSALGDAANGFVALQRSHMREDAKRQKDMLKFNLLINTAVAIGAGVAKAFSSSATIYDAIATALAMVATVAGAMAQANEINNSTAIPSYAIGTGYGGHSGGGAWVGEDGPERVNLPTGAMVYTASRSAEMQRWDSAPSREFNPDVDMSTLGSGNSMRRSSSNDYSGGDNAELLAEFRSLNKSINNWQENLSVEFNTRAHGEYGDRRSAAKKVGNITRK